MASKGVELASAYISLSVSTDGVPKEIEKALGGVGAEKAGRDIGRKVSDGIEKEVKKTSIRGALAGKQFASSFSQGMGSIGVTGWMRNLSQEASRSGNRAGFLAGKAMGAGVTAGLSAAVAGIGVVMAGAGYALTKGFERLNTLDQARFKLKALGKTEEQIAKITADVTEVVKGTPFALQDAFGAAVSAIGSGVDSAEELKQYLTAIADAAAFSGTGFQDMAIIFGQVMNKGKLQAEEMLQLNERGIPIQALLQRAYRKSGEELEKMSKDGALSIQDLITAVETGLPGMAKKMGETLQGSLDNMKTAAQRVGAAFITALSGGDTSNITDGVNAVTKSLESLEGWVKNHVPEIVRGVESIGSAFLDAATGVLEMYKHLLKGQELLTRGIGYLSFGEGRKQAFADADAMREQVDNIDELIAKNRENKKSWQEQQEQVANLAQATEDFGDALRKLQSDTNGGVILRAPTAKDLNAINEAKYRIEQIPGSKDFRVIPKTSDATEELESWRKSQEDKPLNIGARAGTQLAEDDVGAWREDEEGNPVRVSVEADTSPAQAQIDDWTTLIMGKPLQIPVQIVQGGTGSPILDSIPGANGSSGNGPGFTIGGAPGLPRSGGGNSLPVAPSQKKGGLGNSATAKPAVGTYGLPSGTNTGGFGTGTSSTFPQWVMDIADTFGIKPSTYSGHQESNRNEPGYAPNPQGLNRGIDWTGPPEALQRFADYLKTVPGTLEQVIYSNPVTGQTTEIAGGRPQPGYFAGDLGGHTDHVHTRQSVPIPLPRANGGAIFGPGGPKADEIPAWLSNGEHVLTARDVAAMGGQGGVYAFRNALHRKNGGEIFKSGAITWPPDEIGPKDKSRPGGIPDLRGNVPGKHLPDWGPGTKFGPPAWDWWLKPVDPNDVLFPEWLGPGYPWKHPLDKNRMKPLGFAEGGDVNVDELLKTMGFKGPDPNTLQHGTTQGQQPPGPPIGPNGQPVGPDGQPIGNDGAQLPPGMLRTEGFIPAAAGFSGKTGGGVVGGVVDLGAEAIKGVIDQAAQAAVTAIAAGVSAGAGAGSFGAGAAAGPAAGAAAQFAIGMGAEAAKRGVDYGAEMINIGIGAGTEILSPFGAPRWLSDVDPTAFVPRQGISAAFATTGEAINSGIRQAFGQGQQQHGAQAGQSPGPVPHQPGPPPGPAPGPVPPPPGVGGAAGQTVQAAPSEPAQPIPQGDGFNFVDIIKGGVFDNGGVLQPNSLGVNLSNRPEYVFTDSQWKTMEAHASRGGGNNITYNVMGKDLDDALREMKKHERRASGPMMRGKAGLG